MRLSRTVTYGLRAAMHLALVPPESRLSCSELARAGKMPERFLLRILRDLVNRGVLMSSRGVDGGYSLSRPAREITVDEIIHALDDTFDTIFPCAEQFSPPARACMAQALQNAAQAARAELRKLSLADLSCGPPAAGNMEQPLSVGPMSLPTGSVDKLIA